MVWLLPPLMGVAAYLALHNLWIWLGRRREPLHLWVAAWSATSLAYVASHYVQVVPGRPEQVLLGGRLTWTSATVLILVIIGLSHALVGYPQPRRLMWAVAAVNVALLAVVWGTALLVGDRPYVRTDLLGFQHQTPVPGPLVIAFVPYLVAVFGYVWWRVGLGGLGEGERRAIRVALVMYVLLGLNDVLHEGRLIQSVRVFDFAFVAVGAALTYLLVRRYNRLHGQLEEEISERTREVHARTEEMAALLRAGQGVLARLDLRETLDRIVREASRIARAPHVTLLLVDREAGVLRPAAASGGPAPPDFTVPLGESYSGTIAASGEMLFVANTRNDPRNPLAQRDRERGIRTFLGLPVKIRDEVLGVLTFNTEEPREYSRAELETLSSFAATAALAIDNARLHEGLARRLARVETLARVSRLVSASLERDVVLREIWRSAALLMGVRAANFWLADEERRTLELVGVSDPALEADWPARTMSFDQGTGGWVAKHRRPLNVPDVFADERPLQPGWWRTHGLRSYHGVPVLHEGALLGVLSLLGAGPIRVEPEDEALLEAFAAQAAVAIKNASLYESAQAQARELRALHGVGTALVSTLDLVSVLGSITTSAMELTGAGASAVFELEPGEGLLHLRASRGIDESRMPKALRLGQGAAGAAALRREPVWSPDVSAQPLPGYDEEAPGAGKPLGEMVRELSYRGLLGVPLVSRDEVFGAISLYWREAHSPEDREIRLVTAFAQQAAVVLENARLHAALGRRLARMEALARLTRALSSSLDRDRILTEIARAAAELGEARFVTIWLVDEATRTLTRGGVSDPGITADRAPAAVPFGRSGVGWVAAHRRALRVDDTFADERFLDPGWRRRHGLKAFLGMPVIHEGALVAVLSLSGPQPFSREPDDEALLAAFTAQAAVAIGNASLYEAEGQARRAAELALAQVKQLQGMLPICAYCKKIRDDSNYWQTIESYIGERSQATFSHGICPDCSEKIVKPELERWRREQGKDR